MQDVLTKGLLEALHDTEEQAGARCNARAASSEAAADWLVTERGGVHYSLEFFVAERGPSLTCAWIIPAEATADILADCVRHLRTAQGRDDQRNTVIPELRAFMAPVGGGDE